MNENIKKMANKKSTKKNKPVGQAVKKSDLVSAIINLMNDEPTKIVNPKQISHALAYKTASQRKLVIEAIEDLVLLGQLRRIGYGKYQLNLRQSYIEGVLDRQMQAKKTFLIPSDGGEPIFVAERSMGCALNGDRVKLLLYPRRKDRQEEGEVVEVIERKRNEFVGILDSKQGVAFLKVDKKILPMNIVIPFDSLNGAKAKQRCIASIVEWEDKEQNPIGEIIEVLGNIGDNNAEMHAILAEFGLPHNYPKAIEEAANLIPEAIPADEIARRRDMRDITTFTIDPRDAKDFDDALSIRQITSPEYGDVWEIGVHIADVTHYVTPDSIIEEEAYKRATSIYLVDRTIPMLPERLSNEICSLRPNEDKLCYSVVFLMNDFAEIMDYQICRTAINSDRRFTYEEAQNIIESLEGDFADEILKLNELAQILRSKRFAKGAIAFDRVEVRFDIDEKGKPLSVFFKEAKEANKLIEEFMLLANRTVATHIGKPQGRGRKPKPFVYRVHDEPNLDKLQNFSDFIKRFGYKLKTQGSKKAVSSSINRLLDDVVGSNEQNLIETLAIRSMAKASYTTDNIGHYGLAFDYYSHFTSPIRRYPDMMAHRLLSKYILDDPDTGLNVQQDYLEEQCEHSSQMEQLAAQAERASIKYKQVEFMADRIGKVYEGVISGVTEWGIYVEITENKCEGMIPIRNLADDYYVFDDKNYCIIGRRHGKKYQLGDILSVKVARADLVKKQLDFELLN